MTQNLKIESDAFSAGQIESKVWAAEELEQAVKNLNTGPLRICILGGWYSLLHFILQVRKNIEIEYCRSIDIDPVVSHIANAINNTWETDSWLFRAFPKDANEIIFEDDQINCVINTSTEHFSSDIWFENIPVGTIVLIQSNDLKIDSHVNLVSSLDEFKNKYRLNSILYQGQKTVTNYTRFMLIGIK